jgi:hypothetical protein
VGLTGAALGLDGVRALGLLVFCVLGAGSAPWQLDPGIGLPARLALTVLTGLAGITATAVLMAATHLWYPIAAFGVVVGGAVCLHVLGARAALRGARPSVRWAGPRARVVWVAWPAARRVVRARAGWAARARSGWLAQARAGWFAQARSPAVLAAAAGVVICFGVALAHRHVDPTIGGFVLRIGVGWYVGLGLILIAPALARDHDERQLAIPVLALLLVLTLTPALVYDGPRSQSAAGHADLIQQIRSVHRTDSIVQVYNDWPGFFAAMAWLCDITGVRDPMRLAAFWPAVVGVLRLAALRYFFGQVLPVGYRCWTAVALALLVDVPGTFSPRSMGVVIGLVTFGLALSDRRGPARTALLLLAGAVLAVSHQLTSFTVGGVLVVLVLFRQVRPWWTPALVLGPAVGWTVLHGSAVSRVVPPARTGRLQDFHPPQAPSAPGLERLPIVGATVSATLIGIGLLCLLALVALIRLRRPARDWALVCCPAVGVVLALVDPYGPEGALRAADFGIPWLAMLAATGLPSVRRVRTRVLLLEATALCTATFLIAGFGLDASNVTRPTDVAAFRHVAERAADRPEAICYLLQLGIGELPAPVPGRASRLRVLTGADLGDPGPPVADADDARRQVAQLTARLLTYTREPIGATQLYVIWSPAVDAYQYEYGVQRPRDFAAVRQAFLDTVYWTVAFVQGRTVVFGFVPARWPGAAP